MELGVGTFHGDFWKWTQFRGEKSDVLLLGMYKRFSNKPDFIRQMYS